MLKKSTPSPYVLKKSTPCPYLLEKSTPCLYVISDHAQVNHSELNKNVNFAKDSLFEGCFYDLELF